MRNRDIGNWIILGIIAAFGLLFIIVGGCKSIKKPKYSAYDSYMYK